MRSMNTVSISGASGWPFLEPRPSPVLKQHLPRRQRLTALGFPIHHRENSKCRPSAITGVPCSLWGQLLGKQLAAIPYIA